MTGPRAVIAGLGAALPEGALDTPLLAARLGTSPDWIARRTGIDRRRRLPPGPGLTALALRASQAALAEASVPAQAVDLILVATSTPDELMPSLATRLQAALGAPAHGGAWDVAAACTGFLAALQLARGQLEAGLAHTALVVGADRPSAWLAPDDRDTQVVFADGAGAAVLQARIGERGLCAHHTLVDGAGADALRAEGGGGADPDARPTLRMRGGVVFRHALRDVAQVAQAACAQAGWALGEVRWWVPHQANARVTASLTRRLGLDPARVLSHLREVGNTSAASIPLALHAHRARPQPGDPVVLCGLGAGLTATAIGLRW